MQITQRSQAEAMHKYPALGVRGSAENQSFLEAFQELKLGGQMSFFDDPEWPMKLADQLASREGWGDKTPAAIDQLRESQPAPEPPAETVTGAGVVRPPVPAEESRDSSEPLTARPQ